MHFKQMLVTAVCVLFLLRLGEFVFDVTFEYLT